MLSSNSNRPKTAAWRVALWTTLAFGIGTALVFCLLEFSIARTVALWNDGWLVAESATVTRIAEQYAATGGRETATRGFMELLASQLAAHSPSRPAPLNTVFVLVKGPDGREKASAGLINSGAFLEAARNVGVGQAKPQPINVPGADAPFRVIAKQVGADVVYFGFSECISSHILQILKALCVVSWALMMAIGFGISFLSARRTLGRVQRVTNIASGIGQHNLHARVPEGEHQDEIGGLTRTFNGMLDRIENCVSQVHTMTDGLAHDLKGPITALRAKLELALSQDGARLSEPVAYTLDELDRLSEFLNQYLDVAEAKAGALRFTREPVDLTALVTDMVELYKPSFSDSGLSLELVRADAVAVHADSRLVQRMLANLLDNELKHVPYGCRIEVSVADHGVVIEDDGPGFPAELQDKIFDRFAKGSLSAGRGLGLAFVQAVMEAHSGTVSADTTHQGARLELKFASESTAIFEADHQLQTVQ